MRLLIQSALALAILIGPASALSCLKTDMARSYKEAAASDLNYVILHGNFTFAPRPAEGGRARADSFRAIFTGALLTGGGFTDRVQVPVTINTSCAGPWCGDVAANLPYLVFVEQDGTNLTLNTGPCPLTAFPEPSVEMLNQIAACAGGGACIPES